MKTASYYFQRFALSVLAPAAVDTFGQRTDAYTSGPTYWGRLEEPSASRSPYADSPQNTQYSTVRLRDFLNIKMGDRLTESRFDEAWEVRSVSRDVLEGETVCEVQRVGDGS